MFFGWIARLGLRTIAGKALGSAGGLLARLWRWLGTLNFYQLGCIALAILLAVQHIRLVIAHRHIAKVELHDAASTRLLNAALADQQKLKRAIAIQNAAVNAMGAKSAADQAIAAKAEKAAGRRADAAQAVGQRLDQSSRSAPAKAAPAGTCEPSAALKEQWQ